MSLFHCEKAAAYMAYDQFQHAMMADMFEYIFSPLVYLWKTYEPYLATCVGVSFIILIALGFLSQQYKELENNRYIQLLGRLLFFPPTLLLLWVMVAMVFQVMFAVVYVAMLVFRTVIYPSIGLVILFTLTCGVIYKILIFDTLKQSKKEACPTSTHKKFSPSLITQMKLYRSFLKTVQMQLLLKAVQADDFEKVKTLLQPDESLACDEEYGSSILLAAAHAGHTQMVKLLLDMGAKVNNKKHGNTALMLAASQGHIDTVKLLLEYGAQPNVQNKKGKTALQLAMKANKQDVVDVLLEMDRQNRT